MRTMPAWEAREQLPVMASFLSGVPTHWVKISPLLSGPLPFVGLALRDDEQSKARIILGQIIPEP